MSDSQFYYYLLLAMKNPFTAAHSPILQLYQRAKSKSVDNKLPGRTRAKSFQQFQIRIIRTALQQHRVIQKDDGFARDRNLQRERQFSKYYGHEFKCLDTPTTPPTPFSSPPAPQRERVEEKRPSDRMSTMLNIRSETINAINSHRAMTFESNFNIQAASRHSQQGPSELCLPSERASSRVSSHHSSERKCSIFNELTNECVEQPEKRKISRFMQHKKSMEDHIKEEYFDQPPPRPSKRTSPRDSMRETPLFCPI